MYQTRGKVVERVSLNPTIMEWLGLTKAMLNNDIDAFVNLLSGLSVFYHLEFSLDQVFTPVSDVLERASLAALTAISKTLASDKTAEGNPSVLEGFLQDIFKGLVLS